MVFGFYIAHILEYILISCINYVLIAVTKHLQKAIQGGQVCFWLTVQRKTVHHCQGRYGIRNMRQLIT